MVCVVILGIVLNGNITQKQHGTRERDKTEKAKSMRIAPKGKQKQPSLTKT